MHTSSEPELEKPYDNANDISISGVETQSGSEHSHINNENYNDDANYEDCRCAYKTAINQFLQQNNIKLFVDIKGLSENKKSVIDICIDGGINSNHTDFPIILQKDINEYFGENSVTIDNYYKAESINVLSKWVHNTYDIPSIELEINGAYRWFESECEIQSLQLLDILYKWLKQCQNIIQPTLPFKISPSTFSKVSGIN